MCITYYIIYFISICIIYSYLWTYIRSSFTGHDEAETGVEKLNETWKDLDY